MENLTKENDWIPVSSAKYPEKGKCVHVTVDDGENTECVIAYMENDGLWYEDKTNCRVGYVTAWKPMQEIKPYKAEEEAIAESENESEENDGWIPCSVKFPKDNEIVQITYLSGCSGKPLCNGFAYRLAGEWRWDDDGIKCGVEITAWKHICKPYMPKKV